MKVIYYQNERKYEFWDNLFVRTMTIITIAFVAIVTIIVEYGTAKISNIAYTNVTVERIPVDEMFDRYIDSLPLPKNEESTTLIVQNDLSTNIKIQTAVEEQEISAIEEYSKTENLPQQFITTTLNTSAYCKCEICCGKTDGKTASGKMATAWHTVAAGRTYPMGTIIYIPALANMPNGGWFEVEDRGGDISNEKLDIFFNTHEEATQYGRKSLEVYIYIPK